MGDSSAISWCDATFNRLPLAAVILDPGVAARYTLAHPGLWMRAEHGAFIFRGVRS